MQKYNKIKFKFEEIYGKFVEGTKVRSKYTWYEEGEKSTKFFLYSEKKRAFQGQIQKLIIDNQEVMDQNKISKISFDFLTKIFSNLTVQNHVIVKSF